GSMGLAPGETWAPGQPTYDSVLDDLLTVCRGGCDEEWPLPDQYNNNPSPTPAHATSIQAVLEHYLGGSETITCNHLLINYPAPIPDQRLGNYLSTCGCDQLLSVDNEADFEAAFGAVPGNFCKDRQACADAKALNPNLTYPLGSLTWTTAEVAQLESTIASAQYLCKENCLDCKDYFDLVGAFNSRFGTADISEQPTLFTNFVNAALGTNFTFASLEQFDQDCRYGKVTTGLAPEIEEYVALFNQLLPGGLLHTQSHTATTLPGLYNHSFYSFSELAVYDYIPIYLGSGSLRINFRSLTPDGCPGGEVVHLTPESLAGYSSASEVLANVQAFTLAYLTGVDLASGPPIEQHHLTALVTGADGVVVEVPIEVTYTCLTTHGGGVALLCENLNLAENDETNCIEGMLSSAEYAAEYAYAQYLATEKEAFIASYTAACVGVAESFTESHNNNQYHYTLFYFDRAGNLSKTVPPEGVNKLSAAQVEELQTFRETNNLVPGSAPHYPTLGGFETTYQYNSMGQPTQSITPDGDTTRMWYDDLGRLTVSQNARQRDFTSNLLVEDPYGPGHGLYAHNYMEYDHLGRMVEAGELIHPQQMVYATAKDPVALAAWKNQASASGAEVVKNRVVKTYYTDPPTATIVSEFEGNSAGDLRNRIAYITVNEGYHYQDGSSLPSPDYGYYYAYDIHGNVAEALQQTKALAADGREFFHSEYAYDLLSGLTHQVDFQKGEVDQFTHRYHYDADNRLKEVWTTKDGHIWDRDADYQYREDGHLARTELGEMKVQGCDFAYTLRGWLKGMNSGVLHPEKDMGKDGALAGADYLSSAPGLHDDIAQDVYGFTISYFEGDYKSIESSPAKDFQVDATGSAFQTDQVNLYNGNIRSVTTAMTDVANNPLEVLATTYRYDQLHRFKESHVFTASDITDLNSLINAQRQHLTTGTQNTLADREVHVDYDANGNIMKLDRRAYTPDPSTGGNNRMDEFDYDYTLNQLKQVADAVGSTSSLGYGDVQAGQAAGNYEYHADGTLKADLQEEIGYIDWTPDGKVRRIYRTATSEKPDVKIEYNAAGIRVYKIEMVKATGGALKPSAEWNYTWYALDATGNNWGVYRKTESKPALHKTEAVIFGSQRIGLDNREVAIGSTLGSTVTRQLGSKTYELSDYLGNVKEVISDRRLPETTVDGIAYQAKVVSYSDYYPFGMLMPGRNGEDVMAKYRYGSQGQEKDDEIKGKGNIANYKFRMQDTRIGRFFSIDPLAPKYPFYSPYSFSGNRLIDAIELEGLEPLLVKDEYGFPKIGDKFEAKYRLNLPNEDVVLIYQGYHGFVIFRNDRDKINSFYEYGYSATNGNIYDTHKEPYDNGKEITALVGVDGVSNINDYPENMFLTTRITAPSFIVYREKIEEGTYGMDNRDYLGNLIPASGFDEEEVVETYAFRFSVSVEDHLNTLKENASEEGATLENVIITLSINRNVSSEHRDLFERTVKEYFEGTAIVNFFLFDTTETDPAVLDDELNKIEADKVRVFSDVLEKL
ncbi:MAG: RHS repeat domain-containing protein, partial [Salibacteraceae bacterium]